MNNENTGNGKKQKIKFTIDDFSNINTKAEFIKSCQDKNLEYQKYIDNFTYEKQLQKLQVELNKLQNWVENTKQRIVLIFEGRDAAGKGGSIRRFIEHMNPRSIRLVALDKPTDIEQGQWYFQRYIKELANPGEIVLFDRSWYNRAVVEPVMGFCTNDQYEKYIRQVPEYEHMLFEDNIKVVKIWFSITKDEQKKRFDSRLTNKLKMWKLSPVDMDSQKLWDIYTKYKEQMFSKTHTIFCPWTIVRTNNKKQARLETIRYVLSLFNYDGKDLTDATINPDPNVVLRYYRSSS
ncbi:MAG: polyphosphate kinase 2 [Gammaproteobacteria bacterium]|nr:MAG: polyphosphate kinase 2 [Gammaproteobacteria bacterium]